MPSATVINLKKARILLEGGHWIQNFLSRDGCYCLAGAVGQAARGYYSLADEAVEELTYIARAAGMADIPTSGYSLEIKIWEFNDEDERTEAEILAVVDEAIKLAEAADA